jgi:glucose-6-phosphate 1-epimerase
MSRQDGPASPGLVEMIRGKSGLGALLLRRGRDEAEVYLHGAHVTRYQPAERKDVLWLSDSSWWQEDRPIRGGVPICFPWFGPKPGDADAPSHGFARILPWQVDATHEEGGKVGVTLSLEDTPFTRSLWDHAFRLEQKVCLSDCLEIHLTVWNTGDEPMPFSEALHTYLAVSDVREVSIAGLKGRTYIDKLKEERRAEQGAELIGFEGETDRIYVDTTDDCILEDPGWKRRIRIAKEGSRSTVIWNPWVDKSRRMEDYGDEEWPGMVCIESANAADNARILEPGKSLRMSVGIAAESLEA